MKSEFKILFKNAGLKITPQREVIFNAILKNKNKNFTTEEIYDMVKYKHSYIGISTVYRSIKIFLKLGLIERARLDNTTVLYCISKNKSSSDGVIICLNCNYVLNLDDDLFNSLNYKINSLYSFEVNKSKNSFYGLCSNCK